MIPLVFTRDFPDPGFPLPTWYVRREPARSCATHALSAGEQHVMIEVGKNLRNMGRERLSS
jgi:hypothetical protein